MRGLLVGGSVCMAFSSPAASQVQTTEKVEHGPAVHEVTVERGEVVYVSGNDMVMKMEDGSLRNFDNVPDSSTVNVDGKQFNIHQLKAGMKIEKQTITSTTPRVVTRVETVTGKVWHIQPPRSVTLTLENGQNQTFRIPEGTKFTVNGQETNAWGLRKGMTVSAQRVTEIPETVVTQQVKHTGTMPPPPPAPKQDVPILIVVAPAAPAATEVAQAEPAPTKLPKTASELPLVGLLGAILCGVSLAITAVRKLAV
jgi:RNase P/RNase MRP subunit p29